MQNFRTRVDSRLPARESQSIFYVVVAGLRPCSWDSPIRLEQFGRALAFRLACKWTTRRDNKSQPDPAVPESPSLAKDLRLCGGYGESPHQFFATARCDHILPRCNQ